MKTIAYILALTLLFSACDNREKKPLVPIDDPEGPQLLLTDLSGNVIATDSIKLSLKSPRKEGSYLLVLKGGSGFKTLTSFAVGGSGTLKVANLPQGSISLANGTYPISWKPSSPGETLLRFTMTEDSQNIREAFLEIATFDNKPPVAFLDARAINQIATREYLFDASKSFDADAKYGGFISTYQFTFENKTVVTDSSSIKWIFSRAGTYILALKITDGDGLTSVATDTVDVQ